MLQISRIKVQEIGTRLLQEQTVPGIFWNSKTPLYELQIPSDVAEKIKADPEWSKLGIVPTDEQIRRIYVRKRYQEVAKPKKSDE